MTHLQSSVLFCTHLEAAHQLLCFTQKYEVWYNLAIRCNLPYKHSSCVLIAEKADFPNSLWDRIMAQRSCRKSGKVSPSAMMIEWVKVNQSFLSVLSCLCESYSLVSIQKWAGLVIRTGPLFLDWLSRSLKISTPGTCDSPDKRSDFLLSCTAGQQILNYLDRKYCFNLTTRLKQHAKNSVKADCWNRS